MRHMTKALSTHKTERGFTLIELLVVMIIIGILAAIAVPIYLNQQKSAADSALTSDLKNAATTYTTWRTQPDASNEKFRSLANNSFYMLVAAPNADWNESSTTVRWNEVESLPKLTASNATYITFVVIPTASATGWHTPHQEGEFCAVGTNARSNYNYTAGSADFSQYNKYLFYDYALGGIKNIEDMVKEYNAGRDSSCYLYVERYKTATGT